MNTTVKLHRTDKTDIKYVVLDGVTYTVTKIGKSYFVVRGDELVAEVGDYKAARAAVATDAGLTDKVTPAEVRVWAKVTGRHDGTRGRLPRHLFEEYANRPAGAWRTRTGKFVKRP